MPGPEADRDLLIAAAREAGRIAKRFFRADPKVWDKGVDGPVTEADYAVDTYLRETLLAARPGYGWLSEETEDDRARLAAERVFIVDPIDGTRAFIDGTSAFAHSMAVVENGAPIAGVVFLPIKGRLFAAARGAGATLNDAPIRTSDPDAVQDARLLATKATLKPAHWPGGVPPVKRVYRPSLAYRMALVGEGRFDGMATFRPTWEWDIAAGALIIAEAGGVVTDGSGQELVFNGETRQVAGVLAGAQRLHAELLARRLG